MQFCFKKMFGSTEKVIEIDKPENGDSFKLIIKDNSLNEDIINIKESSTFEKKAARYNYSMIGNERDQFDCLFPSEIKDLVRIIGITNALGNYFTYFNNVDISIDSFKKYLNDIKGFVFIDWDVVSEISQGSQFLYVTTDVETEEGREELTKHYLLGHISLISYVIANEKGEMYCIESAFLNKARTPFFNKMKNKINRVLIRKFPG